MNDRKRSAIFIRMIEFAFICAVFMCIKGLVVYFWLHMRYKAAVEWLMLIIPTDPLKKK